MLSYYLELVPKLFKIGFPYSLCVLLNFFIDCSRNLVSNGEVMQSGATDGSSNNAGVVPSDLQVGFA